MERPKTFAAVMAAIAVLVGALVDWTCRKQDTASVISGGPTIDYRGVAVRLTKDYPDYETYKDDPLNIAPSENARVAQLVQDAKVDTWLPDVASVTRTAFELQFPGYGLMFFAISGEVPGHQWQYFSVEIPRAGKSRHLMFHASRPGGAFRKVLDFVETEKFSPGGAKG
jgi:hypothetical protein